MRILRSTKLKILGLHETGFGLKKIRQYLAAEISLVIKNYANNNIIERKNGSGKPISAETGLKF